MTGGILAGVLAHLGLDEAAAGCVKPGKKGCKGPKTKKCCKGAVCKGGSKTKTGTCVCKGDQVKCGASCVNLQTNKEHCGGCNQPCGAGETCAQGACVCPAPRTQCGTACVETATDPRHCGGCDQACRGTTATCEQGVCDHLFGCRAGDNYCNGPDPLSSRCPGSSTLCRCITDTSGTPWCTHIRDNLYCGICETNEDGPDGWACYKANFDQGCNCPIDPDNPTTNGTGNACAPVRGAAEVC